jgi:hypothetical protein
MPQSSEKSKDCYLIPFLRRRDAPVSFPRRFVMREGFARIAWELNTQPRKRPAWKCSAELFLPDFDGVRYHFLLSSTILHQRVALQC